MKLRSASALKFFVLLIFLTEFLFPVFTFSPTPVSGREDEQLYKTPVTQNLFITIVTPELNEIKEGREDSWDILPLMGTSPNSPFSRLSSSESVRPVIRCSTPYVKTTLLLFKLYRTLLI